MTKEKAFKEIINGEGADMIQMPPVPNELKFDYQKYFDDSKLAHIRYLKALNEHIERMIHVKCSQEDIEAMRAIIEQNKREIKKYEAHNG